MCIPLVERIVGIWTLIHKKWDVLTAIIRLLSWNHYDLLILIDIFVFVITLVQEKRKEGGKKKEGKKH